jgi:thiamine biosynthesis lipoprotein
MARKSTRRDFLKGRSAARALADTVQEVIPSGGPGGALGSRPEGGYLVHVSRPAMACEFRVFLNAGQYGQGTKVALEVLDLVETLEQQMSVFRPTSEISTINRDAADGPVPVEPRLFALLELAGRIHAETDGAFDITAGPLWETWGFSRRAGTIPSSEQLAEARKRVGWHLVELDPVEKTVRFRVPGVGLNLGSIGKGYALDRCAERMEAAGIGDYLLDGGYSSVLARGGQLGDASHGPAEAPNGWTVGVRHPLRPDRRLAEVRLRNRALATSGSGVQFFRHRGRRLGHILDPRSGQPAEGVLSATVLAPTAALADALATAFYVMGPEGAQQYCHSRPEIAAVIVCPARRAGGIDMTSTGLGENEWNSLQGT